VEILYSYWLVSGEIIGIVLSILIFQTEDTFALLPLGYAFAIASYFILRAVLSKNQMLRQLPLNSKDRTRNIETNKKRLMEIEIFTLCDFAQDNSGKLTVVGTFDGIHSKQFPFVQANFSVACRLRFSEKEIGEHHMRLRLIDMDGKEIVQPIQGNMNIPKPQNGQYSAINLVFQFCSNEI
jgi:hypothetical protein